MEIHFKGIQFEEIKRTDLKFINEVRNASCEYLHNPAKFTLEQTEIWYDQIYSINGHPWFIVYFFGHRIGYIRADLHDDSHYIGMDIHPVYRGRGYSKAVYKEFINFRYKDTQIKDLWLEVLETNPRAIHIYESLGFEKVSKYEFLRGDEMAISYTYKLNLEKWFNTQ